MRASVWLNFCIKLALWKSGVTSILKNEMLLVHSDSTIGSDRQSGWSLLNRYNTSIGWEIYCNRKIKAAIMDRGEKNIEKDHQYTRVWFITWRTGYAVAILSCATELKEVHHWAAMCSIHFIRGKIISPCTYDILDRVRNWKKSIIRGKIISWCMEEDKGFLTAGLGDCLKIRTTSFLLR